MSEPNSCTMQKDQQSKEADVKPTEANQETDDITLEEGSEDNTTLILSIEETTDESSIDKEEEATTQEENIIVKGPKEEAEEAQNSEESTGKQIDEEVILHSHLKKKYDFYTSSILSELSSMTSTMGCWIT
jgi:hypothetical protein